MDAPHTPHQLDKSHEYLDSDYPLLPGEKIIQITEYPPRIHLTLPSPTEQILRLTRSSNEHEIGRAGPSLAALALAPTVAAEHEPLVTPEHLRLYEAVFGRDSLRVAIDLISTYPELARGTVLELAKLQGIEYNVPREEEPGRIAHEARLADDPQALKLTKERGWQWPYYGSVDATPEFIRTLVAYTQVTEENRAFLSETYTDRGGVERTMTHALEAALDWITAKRLESPEGLVEFKSVLPQGIENQVWKDSWDAYHHADGTIANHEQGVSSIEVQVTTYDALIDAAEVFEDVFDDQTRAAALRAQAHELRQAIFTHYWVEDKGGFFALGTDRDANGQLRPLAIRTSNMGHVLNSRLLKGDDPEIVRMREATVRHILSPELLCDAGIRTLASDEKRFRPGAYHNGSVWIWDTHHIAKGLRRLGYTTEAADLDKRLLRVANTTNLFPEYVRGDQHGVSLNTRTVLLWDEVMHRENLVEQPPQEIQAWTVAAIEATLRRIARTTR